jgi:hypothetical protein
MLQHGKRQVRKNIGSKKNKNINITPDVNFLNFNLHNSNKQ